jgi:hypothetical protein
MDGDAFSIGTSGSLVTNLLLLAMMENVSEPPWWRTDFQPYEPTYASQPTGTELIDTWRPFIDAGGGGGFRRKNCPGPRGTSGAQRLAAAPLPPGYNPHKPREEPLHACILVQPDGTIVSIRLLGSTGSGELDARLQATIATRWELIGERAPGPPAWHRVRLDSGPDEGEVLNPGAIY